MSPPRQNGWLGDGARLALALAMPALWLVSLLVRHQFADPDLWGRLSVGAVLFQAGHLPLVDDFSWLARGATWVDHEWATGVVAYAALEHGGEAGLHLLKYALAAVCLFAICRLHRTSYRVALAPAGYALALLGPAYLSAFSATLRAQAFSFAFFMLFIWGLENIRLRRWSLAQLLWVPLAAVAWGNLHGGVIMGALVTALYGVAGFALGQRGAALAHLAAAAGMGLTLAVFNPYGAAYMDFLLHAWTLDRSAITEWQSALSGSLGLRHVVLLLATLHAIVAIVRARASLFSRNRSDEPQVRGACETRFDLVAPALVLLLLVCMSLLAKRIVPFLVFSTIAYLPLLWSTEQLGRLGARLGAALRSRNPLGTLWIPLVVIAAAVFQIANAPEHRSALTSVVPDGRPGSAQRNVVYPVAAVRWLQASPFEGRLLNPFSSGEFLYWNLYPRYRVAMDGRYEEVYSQEQFRAVARFYKAHRPNRPGVVREFAERSRADFVLFRSLWRNREVIAVDPRYREVVVDNAHALSGRVETLDRVPFDSVPEPFGRPPTIADFFDGTSAGRFRNYP